MTHEVFISYKREDEKKVARLVKALEANGVSLWWDKGLGSGASWREQIEQALDQARCVVVVWTKKSTGSAGDFVRDEAGRAKSRGILVPVLLEKTPIPLGFGEVQAIDLVGWNGSAKNAFFLDLVAAIRAKLEGQPPPKPRGPMQRLARRALAGTLSLGAIGAAIAFFANVMSVQEQVCSVQFIQPGVSDICGALGLGGKPTHEERVAWEQLEPNSCNALRAHVERFPSGAFADEATARLTARRITSEDTWIPESRSLRLTTLQSEEPAATEEAAKAQALAQGAVEARSLCEGFATTTRFRLREAAPLPESWMCDGISGGFVCGFSGSAKCDVDVKATTEIETCAGAPT